MIGTVINGQKAAIMEAQRQPQARTPVGISYARLLRIKEVIHKTGLSRSKVYELIGSGSFPAPVKLGERVALWPEGEINHWIDALIQKNRGVLA